VQHGAKYRQDRIRGRDWSGFTDLWGIEGRLALSRRWDLGLHGDLLHTWRSGQIDYRSAVSVGCRILDEAWLSLGYNLTGFEDDDFSRAAFTAQGPFLQYRFKLDQESLTNLLGHPSASGQPAVEAH